MYSRQDVVEIFSTFLKIEGNASRIWQCEPRLQRSMLRTSQLHEQLFSKATWVSYWYQQQLSDQPLTTVQLAQQHLLAYVQEACYWAAYRFQEKVYRSGSGSCHGFEDYFQMAQIYFPKVLAGFSPERGASLETYAEVSFRNHLRDVVRQQKILNVCSNWSLLRRVSHKRLLETLEAQGLSETTAQQYALAWIQFKEVWAIGPQPPNPRPQPRQAAPTAEQWRLITQGYNHSKPPQEKSLAPQDMEQKLSQLSQWVRSALYPSLKSLNQPLSKGTGKETLDNLADAATVNESASGSSASLSLLILEEEEVQRQHQRRTLQTVLEQTLPNLKSRWRTAMELYYREQLIQSEIAQRMNCSQPSVARYLIRAREALLCALVTWAEQELNISPDPDLIRQQGEVIDEWLKLHYDNG